MITDTFLVGAVLVTVDKVYPDGTMKVTGDPYFEDMVITPDMVVKEN